MTRIYGLFISLLIFLAAPASAALKVVTSTTDLADIAGSIGGAYVNAESITLGPQDPHYVQAKPSYMVKLSRADLLVSVGLELEVGWLPSLIQGARNPAILPGRPGFLEAASAITPIEVPSGAVDRSQGDIHPLGNPHFWLDPENGKKIAARLAGKLGELDAEHKQVFNDNLKRFDGRIGAALKRWQAALAPFKGDKVVSYHRTFNYLLKRFGLRSIGYVEERPGIPPGPSHAAELIRLMRAEGVKVLLHEQYFDRKTSDLIASKASAEVVVLPTSVGGVPTAKNYEALIDHIVQSMVKALRKGGR